MSSPHSLILDARTVSRPVFVVGAPHSGTGAIGRALKATPGLHLTMGQRSVLRVVNAFAHQPSTYSGRGAAAAAMIRDAFAQGWQLTPASCLDCAPACRSAAALGPGDAGPCEQQPGLTRFADATPDLAYCSEALTEAFPGAQLVQLIRGGRDSVARMLADPAVMAWFRPGHSNAGEEFPNPFFGIEDETDRDMWSELSPAAKCAMRWRWAIRLAARLHHDLPETRLKTIWFEDVVRRPRQVAAELSEFTSMQVAVPDLFAAGPPGAFPGPPISFPDLTAAQFADVEHVAAPELRYAGYS